MVVTDMPQHPTLAEARGSSCPGGSERRKLTEGSAPGSGLKGSVCPREAAQNWSTQRAGELREAGGSAKTACAGRGGGGRPQEDRQEGQPGPTLMPCPGSHSSAHWACRRKDSRTLGRACPGSRLSPSHPGLPPRGKEAHREDDSTQGEAKVTSAQRY